MHCTLSLLLSLLQIPAGETIVTASRSGPTITASAADVITISGERLRNTGERTLPRAIAKAAGGSVWMQETNTGGGSPILRGWMGPHVLIVVDGVRLNDSSTRLGPNQSLATIDPAIVDRVEVVKGTNSVLYGSDAIGGVILIWTRSRAPGSEAATRTLGAVDLTLGGQYESASQGGEVFIDTSWANPTNGVRVIGSLEARDDLRSGSGVIDNTGYHSNGFFSTWHHALSAEQSLRATLRIHRDFDVPRTDRLNVGFGQTQPSNEEFDFKLQDNTGYTLTYDDSRAGSLADSFQARVFLRHYEEERQIRATGSSARRLEQDEVSGLGAGIDLKKRVGEQHLLTYGLDFERDDVDSDRVDTNITTGAQTERPGSFAPNSHYASAGAFVQDETTAFLPFAVTFGVRYSYFDFSFNEFTATSAGGAEYTGDFDALSASLQAAREVAEGLRLTGTIAQGFRAPHLDDLARNSTIFGGTELANPDLDPETSLMAELAADYHNGPWLGSLALYHSTVSDYIGRALLDAGDPGTLGDETYIRQNTGTVAIYGVEFELRRRLGDEASPWSLGCGVTYTRGRQYDDTINPVTGTATFDDVPAQRIPPLNGQVSFTWAPEEAAEGLGWAEIRVVAADEQEALNPNDLADPRIDPTGTDAWATLNLDLGGSLGSKGSHSRWTLGVHNVLDEDYRVHASGFDAPGVNAVIGLQWTF